MSIGFLLVILNCLTSLIIVNTMMKKIMTTDPDERKPEPWTYADPDERKPEPW